MPRVVWMPGRLRTEIHLTGADTGGALCLLVDQPPAGWALSTHRHRNEAETIHVVEGEFSMVIDGRESRLGPGDTAHVPRGVPHSGANVGAVTGRRVVMFSPAGLENFFAEVGTSEPAVEPDLGAALDAARRYGWQF